MPARRSRRSGLANLADRASGLGGTLRVGPAEGGGTELDLARPAAAGRRAERWTTDA